MDKVSAGKIGKYEILKVLGRGGMGEVLLAQDEDLGRRVAIKRPLPSAMEEGLARFQVEAKAATLRHPNIPAVYEMGTYEGLPFIAMEFVEGENLDSIIKSGRQLDLIDKLRIIEQVCSALGYAHENSIIHRDIKPANIIVQADGVAKIIDFGIAKIQDSSRGLTQTSQVIGSLHYIAPERFKGGAIDGRVDIFSAGVTLFKLLTGVEPFTGGEATASYKIVNEAHTPLSNYLHNYPPALDDIIAKSLAKNPEDRYATGEDFGDALHEVIEELKRSRITGLFSDAERLAAEKRFTPALELLDEAIKLDPANTQVRKLRRLVRDRQQQIQREQRFQECVLRAEEALAAGKFEEALAQYKEAENLDPTSQDVKQKIQLAEARQRRHEMSVRALAEAEVVKARGDITGALRILTRAAQEDPENRKLQAAIDALSRQAEIEARRGQILDILAKARTQLAGRNFTAVEELLAQAEGIDATNIEIDALRREVARARDQEQRREVIEQIQARVAEFMRTGAIEQAAELLNRAIEKLPSETSLHRLKVEVEAEMRKLEARRLVDSTIAQCRELFKTSPFEALAAVQAALEQLPGEERLVAYERSLRKDLDAVRSEQLLGDTLTKARDLLSTQQYDKAIVVLESYQLEFGQNEDIQHLLTFAQGELAALQRSSILERCNSEGRALIRDGRLDEAIRLLEDGVRQTSDPGLASLLEEARDQRNAQSRKIEILQKRVEMLRERGELDEAVGLLEEHLASAPGNTGLRERLSTLAAERDQKQVTQRAIAAARDALARKDFAAGLDSLHTVARAYGDSPALQAAVQEIEAARAVEAQIIVSKSIETARACLLEKNTQGALEAIKSAAPIIEYADEKRQADWQRITASVKTALEKSGASTEQLTGIAVVQQRKLPLWAIVSVGVVVLAVAGLAVWKLLTPAPVAPPAITQIDITKAPPGARISIDDGPAQLTDSTGELKIKVTPGQHSVTVTADGYEAVTDDPVKVSQGETYGYPARLAKALAAGTKTGTLSFVTPPDLPVVRVFVDDQPKGPRHAGDKIQLSVGDHRVHYVWTGYKDSGVHVIQIAQNSDYSDHVVLEKEVAPPPTAKTPSNPQPQQQSQTTPQVQVPATPPQAPAALPTGNLSVSATSIERGKPVTIAWQVTNAASANISEVGGVAPHGDTIVYPTRTTTYILSANNTPLDQKTVEVHEPPQQVQTPAAPQPVAAPRPTLPDESTLSAALGPYTATFNKAISNKDKKECKATLDAPYHGQLKMFDNWCGQAKRIDAKENSCQVGGSPDAPTLTCAETTTIVDLDGSPHPSQRSRTFHFVKGGDGSWQISSF